jgi:hypothetical protein
MFPMIQKPELDKCSYEAIKKLRKQVSAKFLASGSFAHVCTIPKKGSVIKLGVIRDNNTYLEFVRGLSKAKKHNPYFPKIEKVELYGTGYNAIFAVYMERLQETAATHRGRQAANRIHDAVIEGARADVALFSASVVLRKLVVAAESTAFLDLHAWNIMGRGKQFVITDPVANFMGCWD